MDFLSGLDFSRYFDFEANVVKWRNMTNHSKNEPKGHIALIEEKRFSPLKREIENIFWKYIFCEFDFTEKIMVYGQFVLSFKNLWPWFFIGKSKNIFFQMQIESIEGFTEVCGRKKKNVKKLTANLNIKKSPEEENNNLKDEGFATASPTESEESLGKTFTP